jgi:hypothetical protein
VLLVLHGCGGRTQDTPDHETPESFAQPAGHGKMLEALARIADRADEEHYYLESRTARDLRAELDRLGDDAPWKLHLTYGVAELRLGHEQTGIEHLTRAYDLVHGPDFEAPVAVLSQVSFYLGVGYLRLAETQNCCERRTARSCILPIQGSGRHSRPAGSQNAIRHFLEVLELSPEKTYGYFSAQWLLNIAHMTLGSYPDEVPEAYLVPPEAFQPEADFPRFVNIAAELGVDTFNLAGGVIIDDFDGDDYLDIVSSTWDPSGQIRFFRNNRDGSFTDRSVASGLQGLYGGLNLVQADYDNDGDVDFLILRGAWLGQGGQHPNSLVRNNGDGTFTDVTFEAGLGVAHYPTQTAAWADYDLDGDLDLYIGNEDSQQVPFPCQLFRNNGDGTFVDVAESAGVRQRGFAKAVIWGDYDSDRFPDLYVSNLGAPNRLYRNRGDGTFADVAPQLHVTGPEQSFPAWFWDFDNDGALDLLVFAYHLGIGEIAAHYLGSPVEFDLASLYRSDGQGGFQDVSRQLGLTYPILPMGSNFGDVDNDGYLDLYLGTGNNYYFSLMPNLMFWNRGGRRFTNVTMAGGFGHLQKGHGIAFADVDNDGDQDIFAQMGGAYPGDKFANAFFHNPGFGNHWITVKAVGHRSNRSAIGTRIRVEIEEDGSVRSIYRHVSSGGSFGANPLRQTIGLGQADRILRIELFWPTTGQTQTFRDVPPDRTIQVVEGADAFTTLPLERLSLPSGSTVSLP